MCKIRSISRLVLRLSLSASLLLVASCSKSPEEKYAQFMKNGTEQLEAKAYNRAILEYRNAIQALPKNAEGHFQLAMAYLGAERGADAVAELRKATELDPNHAKAQLKLAELMILSGNREIVGEAATLVQGVLQKDPSNSDAIYEFAATEAQLGRPEQAEELLKKLLDKSPADLRSAIGLAQLRISKKDYEGATKILTEFVEKTPNSSGGELALGSMYAALGNWASAELHARSAVRLDSKNAGALTLLGAIQLRSGKNIEADDTYKRLSQIPEAKLAYADFLWREKRIPDVIRELEQVFKADPANTGARSRLVMAYAAANRPDNARAVLTEALTKNPKDLQALIQSGLLNTDQGKFADAEKNVNQIYGIDPGSIQARYISARIAISRGELLRARTDLSKILETTPAAITPRLDLVRVLLDSNNLQAAQETLNATPANQKQTVEFVITQAWVWIAQGNRAEARKAVDAVLKTARIPDALIQDGILHIAERDLAGARKPLEEALRQNPEDLRALGALAQTYPKGQEDAAAKNLRAIVDQKPGSFRLQMFWAQWLLAQGRQSEAKSALVAAKTADTTQAGPDLLLSRIEIAGGNLQSARDRLKPLIAGGTQNVDAHVLLAGVEESLNNPAASIDLYTKAVAMDSRNTIALNNLAFALSRDPSRLDEARKYAQSAKELAPENSHTLDTLGWIYYRKGLYQLAAKELELALAAESRPSIQYHLGLTYKRAGNTSKGDQLVATALSAQPDLIKTLP